jgi:hypothetical protein
MREIPHNIIVAAKRLVRNGDFSAVMAHLVNEQAVVCLNMDVNNKDQLQLARVYYDALSTVPDLVDNIAKETEQQDG